MNRPLGARPVNLALRVAKNAWKLPVVGDIIERDYRRQFFSGYGHYYGIFDDFAAARAAIPAQKQVGFDHERPAQLYRDRMQKACQSDYGPLFWLEKILDASSVIFDFGGHVGISYHGWRRYLSYAPTLRWIVYDLPSVTKVGEELARGLPSTGLSFTNDLRDAKDCTIFMAAGALQFLDRSLASILDEAGVRPKHLIVNKMPLYDGQPFVTLQSAGGSFHPYQIYNRAQWVKGITDLGYRVVDDWQNAEQQCIVPFTKDKDIKAYSGYYFIRS
jgi:putative methyltransferase (TIGR04325 family)